LNLKATANQLYYTGRLRDNHCSLFLSSCSVSRGILIAILLLYISTTIFFEKRVDAVITSARKILVFRAHGGIGGTLRFPWCPEVGHAHDMIAVSVDL
jgi:hypothetical protein